MSGIGHRSLRRINSTCTVDIFCFHEPTHTVALCISVPSPFGLFNQLCRPPDTQPSMPRNSVYIRPIGRPSRFTSCVRPRMEIFGARRDLDFCRGYSLVVSPRPRRASCVLGIRSTKRSSGKANRVMTAETNCPARQTLTRRHGKFCSF